MLWQDWVILGGQAICLVSLVPTVRDRAKWPPVATVLPTGAALALMAAALLTLGLYLSATMAFALALTWLWMLWRW